MLFVCCVCASAAGQGGGKSSAPVTPAPSLYWWNDTIGEDTDYVEATLENGGEVAMPRFAPAEHLFCRPDARVCTTDMC